MHLRASSHEISAHPAHPSEEVRTESAVSTGAGVMAVAFAGKLLHKAKIKHVMHLASNVAQGISDGVAGRRDSSTEDGALLSSDDEEGGPHRDKKPHSSNPLARLLPHRAHSKRPATKTHAADDDYFGEYE